MKSQSDWLEELRQLQEENKLQGVHKGLPSEIYHRSVGVSKTTLDKVNVSTAYYKWWSELSERKQTPAMIFGTLAHAVVLEPDTIKSYVAKPSGLRKGTKAWKEFEEENAGKTIVAADDLNSLYGIVDRIYSNKTATKLLVGEKENSIFWKSYPDFWSKCRPDVTGEKILVDLKFTNDISKHQFTNNASRLGYDMQAAYYLDGANAVAQAEGRPLYEQFIFLAVEKHAPHRLAFYVWDDISIASGRNKYQAAIEKLIEANRTQVYSWGEEEETIQTLVSPLWATENEMAEELI